MTAISLLATPTAAHLITDAAFYHPAGQLLAIETKVGRAEHLSLAFAVSGTVSVVRLATYFSGRRDQREAVGGLPGIARTLRAINSARQPQWEGGGFNDFQIAVAAWDQRTARAWGFLLSTNRAWLGEGYEPYTVAMVDQASSPPSVMMPTNLETFDPIIDGTTLLCYQRSYREGGLGIVGGFGELTTVSAAGITTTRLIDWPEDQIGERINADRQPAAA